MSLEGVVRFGDFNDFLTVCCDPDEDVDSTLKEGSENVVPRGDNERHQQLLPSERRMLDGRKKMVRFLKERANEIDPVEVEKKGAEFVEKATKYPVTVSMLEETISHIVDRPQAFSWLLALGRYAVRVNADIKASLAAKIEKWTDTYGVYISKEEVKACTV